jgi:hypothetical protein
VGLASGGAATQLTRMSSYAYTAYGVTVQVPFPCPALATARADTTPDIVVQEGVVPGGLPSPAMTDRRWDAEPSRFLLRGGRHAGRFLVDGEKITLQRHPNADDSALASAFSREVLAAVLRHRGMLVLHAAAVMTPGGVVVIAGPSGAGKSTTLAALLARGCAMLADEVAVMRLNDNGDVEVLAGPSELRLTEVAARDLGLPPMGDAIRPRPRMKVPVSPGANLAVAPGKLAGLCVLQIRPGPKLRTRVLSGSEKFEALQNCFYGPLFAEEHPAMFPLCRAVVGQVDIRLIERPAERWSLPAVSDIVLRVASVAAI